MKLYLCANGYTKQQMELVKDCVDILQGLNHECFVDENPKLSNANFNPEDCDMIVSLGGDGRLLMAGQLALKYNKPLIGINAGRLGYLCAIDINELDKFNEILNECHLEKRSVLTLNYIDKIYYAINDVIVSKGYFGRTVDLTALADNKEIMKVRGDGLIIATPTGSTAYNVSAGGPILDLDSNIFVITPICAHGNDVKPIVINDNKEIDIIVNHDDAGIYIDGELIGNSKESIKVNKAEQVLQLYVK